MRTNAVLRDILEDRLPEPDPKRPRMDDPESKGVIIRTPVKLKTRSLSESTPKLQPSPTLKEVPRRTQDDHNNSNGTSTPKRADPPVLGLHLHVPRRDLALGSPPMHKDMPPSSPIQHLGNRTPLSPKTTDARSPYASPMSVLPRHSRGIEFARAATHLHHSTLAEQSSPDSSPMISQRGMQIPRRKQSINAMMIDGPFFSHHRDGGSGISSSLGNINLLAPDSTESSSDDDLEPNDMEDHEDLILGTPNLHRKSPSAPVGPPRNSWGTTLNLASSNSFLGFRKPKFQERGRNSSSSASGNSNLASPVPTSPSGTKMSIEASYFPGASKNVARKPSSRRESISKVTNELHISSGNDSGDEAGFPVPSTPGVIRRPVTRRTNMLVGTVPASIIPLNSRLTICFSRKPGLLGG
jgi:hypothetical protein